MSLSLYGGADFEAEGGGRAAEDGLPSGGRKLSTRLTLQLQQGVAKAMIFDDPAPGHVAGDVYRRRFLFCARDFGIQDRVQGSVFSHVLAYFEDGGKRPRPSHVDMFQLRVDEVVPRALLGSGRPRSRGQAASGTDGEEGEVPEYRLDLRLPPLRLTLDQDVVDFLLGFVQECTRRAYVETEDQDRFDGEDLEPAGGGGGGGGAGSPAGGRAAPPAFFQHVSVGALLLSVDYRAKRLDVDALRRGDY